MTNQNKLWDRRGRRGATSSIRAF